MIDLQRDVARYRRRQRRVRSLDAKLGDVGEHPAVKRYLAYRYVMETERRFLEVEASWLAEKAALSVGKDGGG